MAEAVAILLAYHILFYWKAYYRPFDLARSELLSTFFPSWIHLGRGGGKHDPYYWGNYHAHPVLSSYYPPHLLSSKISVSFKVLLRLCALHSLFASIGWFYLVHHWAGDLVALFGAITLTYSGYNIKQQPCIAYTISWLPWLLLGVVCGNLPLSSLSFGMVLLSGYYPLGIQCFLVSLMATWLSTPQDFSWVIWGTIIGLPQVIPFVRHLPNTIRAHAHDDIGRIPWWQIILEVAFPVRVSLNQVGYWEMSYYAGMLTVLLILLSHSVKSLLLFIFMALMTGLLSKYFPRIPARWGFSFQASLAYCSISSLQTLRLSNSILIVLCAIQMLDLYLHNSPLLITRPYSELPKKPSLAFNTKLTQFLSTNPGRISGLPYPLFTGHINKLVTLGYCGGMQTKAMAKLRGDNNPNGSGFHDWFRLKGDGDELDAYGIKWAVRRTRPVGWLATPVRHLWENPRIK